MNAQADFRSSMDDLDDLRGRPDAERIQIVMYTVALLALARLSLSASSISNVISIIFTIV
jgi:hypothetical protein